MSTQDPIADMMTRIRNGQQAKKLEVSMPSSKEKASIAEVLKGEGYIKDYQVEEHDKKAVLIVYLAYYKGQSVIEEIQRISRPGLRVYRGCGELPQVRGGLGETIISTNQGVMSGSKAKSLSLGGEVIGYVV
jgi:small subunit ribosomal protein S8